MNNSNARNSAHEMLIAHIREHPEGSSSKSLAENILKFQNPPPPLARKMIDGIIGQDRRCRVAPDGLWYPVADHCADKSASMEEIPWVAVFLISGDVSGGAPVAHISAWNIYPAPSVLASEWMRDPAGLNSEDSLSLSSPLDTDFRGPEAALRSINAHLEQRRAVFLSARDQNVFMRECLRFGESGCDDTILISQLLTVAGLPVPRPINLDTCYQNIFDRAPVIATAYRHGECFAECVWETLNRLVAQGIVSDGCLEKLETQDSAIGQWTGRNFSLDSIISQPSCPGVYGFKDSAGKFLYIGKAKNLNRRLRSYFRATEETPRKLERLQKEACELTVHKCGSELESLIYEYRLIRKYAPPLNTQTAIDERKGEFIPVQDCIILLPHAEADKGMSIWMRRDQKVALKPFNCDFSDRARLEEELQSFFFSNRLAPDPGDFAEMEIAVRWVKRNEMHLVIVPVSRLATGGEALEWMRSSWLENGK